MVVEVVVENEVHHEGGGGHLKVVVGYAPGVLGQLPALNLRLTGGGGWTGGWKDRWINGWKTG